MRALVAGLGNIFAGDDAFGVEVARSLVPRRWPDGVQVADFGIRGVHLAYELLNGYDLVVIVDAVERGGLPGTLYVIDHADDPPATPDPGIPETPMDAHDLGPDGVLALVPALGGRLGRVVVVGCEPEDVTAGVGLSAPVAASVAAAAELVADIVSRARASRVDAQGVESRAIGPRGVDRSKAAESGRRAIGASGGQVRTGGGRR